MVGAAGVPAVVVDEGAPAVDWLVVTALFEPQAPSNIVHANVAAPKARLLACLRLSNLSQPHQ